MRKVLITGAGGFIGSHLVELCVKKGYSVRAMIHYNSINHWGWLENLPCKKSIEIISGDIRDFDSVYDAVKGCDTIFHLAALIGIPYSYVSPLAYIRTNIEGTYNVLQSSKQLNIKNILITSTSETYGSAQYVPIDEHHPMVGQSPYSATKISADQIALSFYKSFNLPVKIVRPFNTYGPRQSARAMIPTIISQILQGNKSIKLGNLDPTRDLTYVKDTVNGFYEIAKLKTHFGEAINIGMNKEISVRQLVDLIADLMRVKIRIQKDFARIRPRNSEVERLNCDNSKIRTYTDWHATYDLTSGLKETISWMRKNYKKYKAESYNI
ncbi:MAG: NAD-dependent 4,6-dehydratase LegB [bacterium]